MSTEHNNHEPSSVNDLRDRLLERALCEVVGGETPPDLSDHILGTKRPSTLVAEQAAEERRPGRAWRFAALAAVLLIGAIPLLVPSVQPARESSGTLVAQRALERVERSSKSVAPRDGSPTPSPYYMNDDFQYDAPGPEYRLAREAQPAAPGVGTAGPGPGTIPQASELTRAKNTTEIPRFTSDLNVSPRQNSFEVAGMPGNVEVGPPWSFEGAESRGRSGPVLPSEPNGQLLSPIIAQDTSAQSTSTPAGIVATSPASPTTTAPAITHGIEVRNLDESGQQSGQAQNHLITDFSTITTSTWDKLADESLVPQSLDDTTVIFRDRRRELEAVAATEFGFNGNAANGRRIRGDLDGDGLPDAPGFRPEKTTDLGTGPGLPGDQYVRIQENPFIKAEGGAAVSTFSIDVDTASYTNVRRFLLSDNLLPPPDAVRIEEFVNYFKYNYAPPKNMPTPAAGEEMPPTDGKASSNKPAPFAAHIEVAACPWKPEHRLVRIGIKGAEMDRRERPKSNLVFLVDVSGSMNEPNKLPLVVDGLKELTRELGENDRVALVVYAGNAGLVLPSTQGNQRETIVAALDRLSAGGSTAGGAGVQLAYQIAQDHFIEGGTNRVILCTDGDFNVGTTSTADLERMVEEKAKDTQVFLSVLGFGRGNLNDQMMEAISNRGNGNYSYVDTLREARRVFVEEMSGTLVTIAKDVKIQVEFNPRQVAGYRLIGYENRMLRTEDFNDDKKDAGEIGAGHTVTALYEVIPAGKPVDLPPVDELRYQQSADVAAEAKQSDSNQAESATGQADITRELLVLKMKYKRPEADTSVDTLQWPVTDDGKAFSAASADFQFASAVAGLGMLLRNSEHKGNLTFAADLELAQGGLGQDEGGYRAELVEMIRKARQLRGE